MKKSTPVQILKNLKQPAPDASTEKRTDGRRVITSFKKSDFEKVFNWRGTQEEAPVVNPQQKINTLVKQLLNIEKKNELRSLGATKKIQNDQLKTVDFKFLSTVTSPRIPSSPRLPPRSSQQSPLPQKIESKPKTPSKFMRSPKLEARHLMKELIKAKQDIEKKQSDEINPHQLSIEQGLPSGVVQGDEEEKKAEIVQKEELGKRRFDEFYKRYIKKEVEPVKGSLPIKQLNIDALKKAKRPPRPQEANNGGGVNPESSEASSNLPTATDGPKKMPRRKQATCNYINFE